MLTKTIDGVDTSYSYNENDQLTTQGSVTFTYDDNGNLVSDNNNTYSYDEKNRLIKVITPNDTVEYSYDANDNRIAKTTSNGTTTYLIDANTPYAQVITESKDDGTEIKYTYGNDLISDGSHTFLTDALGSTRGLVDSSEALTDSYAYTPYGELANHDGTSENSFLFTGEQLDSETEDYYLRARYYSPNFSRFLSRDSYDGTMNSPVTQNHYLYAGANPSMFVDPSGKMFIGISIASFNFTSVRSVNTLSSIQKYGPYTYRASNIALRYSVRSVKQLKALKRSNSRLFANVGKDKLEIHHILEKRFWTNAKDSRIKSMFEHADDIPGVALTKTRHREITNRWIKALGRKGMKDFKGYDKITIEDLYNAVGTVYRDDPLQKQAIARKLMEFMF